MVVTARQRQLLKFVAERGSVDLREVNAVMGWSDEEHRVTTRPLIENGLVTVTLSISADLSPRASPGWWEITDIGREALSLAPRPL
jgi:hypothetical protein